jgi:hypothetical protein
MKMILSGKRKVTIHQALNAARVLRLSPEETSYLESLVLKESANGAWQKAYYANVLKQKRKKRSVVTRGTSQKSLLADTLALPLLVDVMDSKDGVPDIPRLAKRFNACPERIARLIMDLKRCDVLQKKADGSFHVVFDKFSHRPLQKRLLTQLLSEASTRIENDFEKDHSLFVTYSFSTTEERLAQLRMDLKALMEKYMSHNQFREDHRQVAQACFQVFPMTRS